tara:strand:+ start:395 stop:1573 length:1179 start_codon:yes stop_codon:yes gene_type:complete
MRHQKSNSKILFIGPFNDIGGRELEVSFIANCFCENFEVKILSTGLLTRKSQIYKFISSSKIDSINSIIYKERFLIKLSTYISYLKNFREKHKLNYISSKFNKKILDLEYYKKSVIRSEISNSNVIFICAQLSSEFLSLIITESNRLGKKIIFRPTGSINIIQARKSINFLRLIDVFICHSKINAQPITHLLNNAIIYNIDQCAIEEKLLLNIPITNSNPENLHFLCISRLSKEKRVDLVIESFLKCPYDDSILYIVGSGSELDNLKILASNNSRIRFLGYIENHRLLEYFRKCTFVIIPYSNEETGPYTAIESMAAGRVIISPKTGAMPERIPKNQFWFERDNLDKKISKALFATKNEISKAANYNRERYKESYRMKIIEKRYLEVLNYNN